MIVIVPNILRDKINEEIDLAMARQPQNLEMYRDDFYHAILNFFNDYGELPDFDVARGTK